jgi:hypothetical protein
MNKSILAIVVVLAVGYLLGIPRAGDFMIIATSVYLLIGGLVWLFTRRLPQHFITNLILVFLGPMALVMILNVTLNTLSGLKGHTAAALLLGIVVGSVFLGARFLRGKSRGIF